MPFENDTSLVLFYTWEHWLLPSGMHTLLTGNKVVFPKVLRVPQKEHSSNPNSLDNKGSWRILKDFYC